MNHQIEVSEKREYIPGFDWIKLFGSIMIAFFHIVLSKRIQLIIAPKYQQLFDNVVPAFFLMAGFLMYQSITRRKTPYTYLKKYVCKYLSFYYLVNLVFFIVLYTLVYFRTGIFMYKDFIYAYATLPLYNHYLYELWFIWPLLIGITISVWIFTNGWETKCIIPFFILYAIASIFIMYNAKLPLPESVRNFLETSQGKMVYKNINTFVGKGIPFTFAGMWISKYKERFFAIKWSKILTVTSICILVEYSALFLLNPDAQILNESISYFLVCLIVFRFILSIKGNALQPFHREVTVFSVITYFFHISENYYLKELGITNDLGRFAILMLINVLIMFIVCNIRNKKQRQPIYEA